MSCGCTCYDGTTPIVKNELECSTKCGGNYEYNCNSKFLGLGISILVSIIVIQLILIGLMIWFSIVTIRKCNGNPAWLKPLVIVLLVLWILTCWFPTGFLLFLILLIILIVFYTQCSTTTLKKR